MTEHINHYSTEELQRMRRDGEDRTDWRRFDRMSEADLKAAIATNDEGDFDWDRVMLGLSHLKKQLTVRFDLDIVDWFRDQEAGYQTKMNQVLRSYVEAQRKK